MKVKRKTPLTNKRTSNAKKSHNTRTLSRFPTKDTHKFYRTVSPSVAYIEDLADALLDYARNNTKAYTLLKFLKQHGIPKQTYYDWIKRFDYLSTAHTSAMEYIGDNRELAAIEGVASAMAIYKKQAHYDPEYKKETERLVELRAKIDNSIKGPGTIQVLFEKFPDCSSVPAIPVKTEDEG